MRRIFADIGMFASVLFLPWWVTLLLGIGFFFVFESYYELLISAFLIDILYGVPLALFGGFTAVHTVGTALIYVPLYLIRKRVRVY